MRFLVVAILGFFLLLLTVEAVYIRGPLTQYDLSNGVNLDSGTNTIVWTDAVDESILLTEAFASIKDEIYYVYDYDQRKYWFNPDSRYDVYNNDVRYASRLFDEVRPEIKYYIRLKSASVLTYDIGPQTLKVILPNGTIIEPAMDEAFVIYNNSLFTKDESIGWLFDDCSDQGDNSSEDVCEDGDGTCLNYSVDTTSPFLNVSVVGVLSGYNATLDVFAYDSDSYVDTIGYWYRGPKNSYWKAWDKMYYSCPGENFCEQSIFVYGVDGAGLYDFLVRAYNRDAYSTSQEVTLNFTE